MPSSAQRVSLSLISINKNYLKDCYSTKTTGRHGIWWGSHKFLTKHNCSILLEICLGALHHTLHSFFVLLCKPITVRCCFYMKYRKATLCCNELKKNCQYLFEQSVLICLGFWWHIGPLRETQPRWCTNFFYIFFPVKHSSLGFFLVSFSLTDLIKFTLITKNVHPFEANVPLSFNDLRYCRKARSNEIKGTLA